MATAFGMTHALPNVMDAMMKRQGDQMTPHVDTGGMHATAAGMVSLPFATAAYMPGGGYINQEPAAIDYPARGVAATGLAWVCLHASRSQTVAGWSRQPGTHYLIAPGPTKPTLPDNAVWLMQVTTASGVLTRVGDRRHLSGLLPPDVRDIRDYGAVEGGVIDCTDAINAATRAFEPWHDDLRGTILIPPGLWKIDGSVWVRNGQSLLGQEFGATKITTAYFLPDGTTPLPGSMFTVGAGFIDGAEVGDSGAGGIPPQIGFLHVDPGRAGGTIRTVSAGWLLHDLFLTNAGVGLMLGGFDGMVSNVIVDQSLQGIVLGGCGNLMLSNIELYICNYGLAIQSNVHNVHVSNLIIEYSTYAHISLPPGTTNVSNVHLTNGSCITNAQYATLDSQVNVQGSTCEVWFHDWEFRNMRGYAVVWYGGTGTRLFFTDCLFDGDPDNPVYDQSSTCGGIELGTMSVSLSHCVFRNLVQSAVHVGGSAAGALRWDGGSVVHADATYIPVLIDTTNPATTVLLRNIDAGARQLYNFQHTVRVDAAGLTNWLAPVETLGGRFYWKVPYRAGEVFLATVAGNTNPPGEAGYRKSATYLVSLSTSYDAGAVVHAIQATLLGQSYPGDTGVVPNLDAQFTFGAGVGAVVPGLLQSGLWYLSIPSTYTSCTFQAQQIHVPQ